MAAIVCFIFCLRQITIETETEVFADVTMHAYARRIQLEFAVTAELLYCISMRLLGFLDVLLAGCSERAITVHELFLKYRNRP